MNVSHTEMETSAARMLSVRVPENVYRTYEQIQIFYGVKQSDLVRMAPLLFVLTAEDSLERRRKEVEQRKGALRSKMNEEWNWLAGELQAIEEERVALTDNEVPGRKFVEHLQDLARKVASATEMEIEIEDTASGLPHYSIFQRQFLQQAASEIANEVREAEIDTLLSPDAHNQYDPKLLAVASTKVGVEQLDNKQKQAVREEFKRALKLRKEFIQSHSDDAVGQAAREVATNMVRPEEVSALLEQIDSKDVPEIPRRYDGPLLAISRKKLGKPLNSSEKSQVRKLFRDALKKIAND